MTPLRRVYSTGSRPSPVKRPSQRHTESAHEGTRRFRAEQRMLDVLAEQDEDDDFAEIEERMR